MTPLLLLLVFVASACGPRAAWQGDETARIDELIRRDPSDRFAPEGIWLSPTIALAPGGHYSVEEGERRRDRSLERFRERQARMEPKAKPAPRPRLRKVRTTAARPGPGYPW